MVAITRTPAIARLQQQLGLPNPDGTLTPFEACIIMSVDVEKYGYGSKDNKPVTEIGLAYLNTQDFRNLPASASNIDITKFVRCYHFRLKESGHLRNGNFGGTDFNKANDFDYGVSEWLWRSQIKQAVQELACVPDPKKPSAFLPVTIIKQGGNGDIADIGEFAEPQFDVLGLPSTPKTLELQTVTNDALPGLYSVGLATVLAHLKLELDNKHNAGNDAMGQLVIALHMAFEEYRQRTVANPNDTPVGDLLRALSTTIKAKAAQLPPVVGTHTHCNRCGKDHTGLCNTRVGTCKRCLGYNRHITAKCFWGNDKILEQRRQENYAHTKANNDKFGRLTAPYVPLEETTLSKKEHILEPETSRREDTRAREAAKQEYDRQWAFLNGGAQADDEYIGQAVEDAIVSVDPGSSSGQDRSSDEQATSSAIATTPEVNQGVKVPSDEMAGLSLEGGTQTTSWAQIVRTSAPVAQDVIQPLAGENGGWPAVQNVGSRGGGAGQGGRGGGGHGRGGARGRGGGRGRGRGSSRGRGGNTAPNRGPATYNGRW